MDKVLPVLLGLEFEDEAVSKTILAHANQHWPISLSNIFHSRLSCSLS